jgi:hypothetical protein
MLLRRRYVCVSGYTDLDPVKAQGSLLGNVFASVRKLPFKARGFVSEATDAQGYEDSDGLVSPEGVCDGASCRVKGGHGEGAYVSTAPVQRLVVPVHTFG